MHCIFLSKLALSFYPTLHSYVKVPKGSRKGRLLNADDQVCFCTYVVSKYGRDYGNIYIYFHSLPTDLLTQGTRSGLVLFSASSSVEHFKYLLEEIFLRIRTIIHQILGLEIENTNFTSGLLGMIVIGTTSVLTPWSLYLCHFSIRDTILYMFNAYLDSMHINVYIVLGGQLPNFVKVQHLVSVIQRSSTCHPTVP